MRVSAPSSSGPPHPPPSSPGTITRRREGCSLRTRPWGGLSHAPASDSTLPPVCAALGGSLDLCAAVGATRTTSGQALAHPSTHACTAHTDTRTQARTHTHTSGAVGATRTTSGPSSLAMAQTDGGVWRWANSYTVGSTTRWHIQGEDAGDQTADSGQGGQHTGKIICDSDGLSRWRCAAALDINEGATQTKGKDTGKRSRD